MRPSLLFAFAVLALAGAASAVVTSASRRTLSQGATFDVAGSDFTKPVRAWLEMEDRRIPLRVLRGATSSAFTAQLVTFPRGTHGECLLGVKTKGTKVPSYFGGMSIELPVISEIAPLAPAPGFEATITGEFFGTRRPRVYVGGVRAKVTAWSDTSITFIVPPGLAPGLQFLDLETRAGPAAVRSMINVAGT
jgi:IPT/TIG domain-containing protein